MSILSYQVLGMYVISVAEIQVFWYKNENLTVLRNWATIYWLFVVSCMSDLVNGLRDGKDENSEIISEHMKK